MSTIKTHAEPYVEGGVNVDGLLGVKDATIFNESKNVTDKSELNKNQPYAVVDFYKYGVSVSNLKNNSSYKSVIVIFQMEIKEVNDGYQELFLYESDTSTTKICDPITNFEHVPGKKGSDYKRYEFYAEIPLNLVSIYLNGFCIRFGAHGNGSDDWKFKDLQVQLLLSYDNAKINSLKKVTNADLYHY